MKRWIKVVDSTLRDGEQCPGLVFSPEEKINLALQLDKIGVYEIEAGMYSTRVEGDGVIREIVEKRKNAKISLWSTLNPDSVREAAKQKPDIIHIGTPVSYTQIYHKIKKNKKWVENQLKECIDVANTYQIPVTVGLEDASRSELSFLIYLIREIEKLGVTTVRVADTVGILSPSRAREMVIQLKENTDVAIEIHEHNDLGMAVANSIVMVNAGADLVDVTLLGLGERAGNCNFYHLVKAAGRKLDLGIKGIDVKKTEDMLKQIIQRGDAFDQRDNL